MIERRTKRSAHREEALQYLVEAVADRSEVRAVALVDDSGRIVAGTGVASDLVGLARIAGKIARAESCPELDAVTEGTDILVRAVWARGEPHYLAALGERVTRMVEAGRRAETILSG
jgi:hypothetical protein